MNDNGRLTCD